MLLRNLQIPIIQVIRQMPARAPGLARQRVPRLEHHHLVAARDQLVRDVDAGDA
jgi:hypothetical protein